MRSCCLSLSVSVKYVTANDLEKGFVSDMGVLLVFSKVLFVPPGSRRHPGLFPLLQRQQLVAGGGGAERLHCTLRCHLLCGDHNGKGLL